MNELPSFRIGCMSEWNFEVFLPRKPEVLLSYR